MNSRSIFVRKIIYLSAIGLLLIPLYVLSQPATEAAKGEPAKPGGKLAQLRQKYKLSQAQLGEIDPTSVTIKLATLGLRGVAANILWEKATDYKMKKDWTNFGATLNQITKVQPHFINVWINQAWNLSYNCSVAFDDYRERYRWVVKGFEFLEEGIKYNDRQPRLLWELGWDISAKIGKADEVKQYRRLFAKDEDFAATLPADVRNGGLTERGLLDNWLVGKGWFERVVEMVNAGMVMMGQGMAEKEEYGMKGRSPLLYRSNAPMCQMYYADAIETDGTFGEVARKAWRDAGNQWQAYGAEEIPTSYRREDSDEPIKIRLNDEEREEAEAKSYVARLDALKPELRKKIIAEKKAKLSDKQRQALETPPEKRTPKQFELAAQAEQAMQVTHDEVAHRISGPKRKEAIQFAKQAAEHEQLAMFIRRYRDVVNFTSWWKRAQAEQSPELLSARSLVSQADRAYADGDLVAASKLYREALKAWRKALDLHKEYITDVVTGEDLMEMIKRYRRVLNQLDEPFPQPFILQDIIDHQQK